MSVKKKVTVPAEPIEPYVEIERTGRLEHKVFAKAYEAVQS